MKFRDNTGLMIGQHFSPFQCTLKGISVAVIHEAVQVMLVTEASSL
jgi:hypothetical protein